MKAAATIGTLRRAGGTIDQPSPGRCDRGAVSDYLQTIRGRLASICLVMLLVAQLAYAQNSTSPTGKQPPANNWPQRVATPGPLENLWQVSPRIFSGGAPRGEEAFRFLRDQGIDTILSVDGHAPDVEGAKSCGLRYVHIPIGYDAIPSDAIRSLMRVSRDISGSIYVHCHHGQHRGPAMAAILCQIDDSRSHAAASEILAAAGTDEKYAGLWNAVRELKLPTDGAALPELVSLAEIGNLVESMSQIDRKFSWLKSAIQRAPHERDEALTRLPIELKELFRELARHPDTLAAADLRMGLEQQQLAFTRLAESINEQNWRAVVDLSTVIESACSECHRLQR